VPLTPLQRRLGRLGRQLSVAAALLCLLVAVLGLLRGEPLEQMLVTAVSLAVAAIPESLPAVVSSSLALGAQRMAARGALVRHLPAVETRRPVHRGVPRGTCDRDAARAGTPPGPGATTVVDLVSGLTGTASNFGTMLSAAAAAAFSGGWAAYALLLVAGVGEAGR
jgi:hypothetical protein